MNKKINISKLNIEIFIILAVAVLYISGPLFSDVYYAGHDLLGLCSRIEGIKAAWDCGQNFPVIMPYAYNGYGYLEFMYPELFLLFPAFLRECNVPMVRALQIFCVIINAATAFITYFSVKSVLAFLSSCPDTESNRETSEKRRIAVISLCSALFYLFAQYRLSDMYVRAAIGEAIAMTFLPLAIAGLFHILSGDRTKWWMAVAGFSGILHCHILSCTMVVPVVLLFSVFYLYRIVTQKRFKEILFALGLFFIINAWYIIPFIRFFLFGLNSEALVEDRPWEHTVLLSQLFSTKANGAGDDYFLRSIGLVGLFIITYSVICIIEQKKKDCCTKLLGVMSLICSLYTLLSLDIMPHEWIWISGGKFQSMLSLMQFPFRLLTVVSASLVFMLALSLFKSKFLSSHLYLALSSILLLSLMGASASLDTFKMSPVGLTSTNNSFEENVPADYLPKDVDPSIFGDTNPYITDGTVTMEKNGTDVTLSYSSPVDTSANIPLLYYPCYTAVDETGNKITLYQHDSKKIGLLLPAGDHTVHLNVRLFW